MSDFSQFKKIHETYAQILPEWMAEYEATGEMRQDPHFMDWVCTKRERS